MLLSDLRSYEFAGATPGGEKVNDHGVGLSLLLHMTDVQGKLAH